MSATVQPRLKIGIAVAGASAIALAPIIQPMPDIAEPLARSVSTAAVALSATTNPIEQWLQIINTAIANGGALAQTYLANPAPILRQLILNGIGYGEQTFTALQSTVTALIDNLRFDNPGGLPVNVQNAWDQIMAGDIANGLPALYGAFTGYFLFSAFPLINLLEIPSTMAQNFANVVEAGVQGALGLVFGTLSIPAAVVGATADQLQSILNAVQTGDWLGAINDAFGVPGAMVGAFFNGFGFNAGLLSPDGLIDMAIRALNSVAEALGAAPPAAAMAAPLVAKAADLGPSALPADESNVTTVVLRTEGAAGAENTEGSAAVEPGAEQPAIDGTTPAEPLAAEPEAAEPDLTEPEITEPDLTVPDLTAPDLTESLSAEPTDTEAESERESGYQDLRSPSAESTDGDLGTGNARSSRPTESTDSARPSSREDRAETSDSGSNSGPEAGGGSSASESSGAAA
ncbi:hypothetical protein [Arthrobacter sp. SLBN-53]|uniref:hypothetical protein n=1 Tax=Arthrobacter sp. SLBN-53 TaxID=2768412 RepID=UPI0011529480|nr:hypothetical protein [Arthrobacter sp. SLBN-53]TQK29582.1 hypothetical protein FBY28_2590 [Arthrobacter sp. SLBN-53]